MKIHRFGLKVLTFLNGMSLMYWVCCIDAIISWQHYLIMAVNFGWLWLMAYCNGWIYETEPFYERNGYYEQEEGEYDDEMSGGYY